VFAAGLVAVAAAGFGGGTAGYLNQDFAHPNIAPLDTDISGDVYINRGYSVTANDGGHVMLTRDGGQYQLYNWSDERQRFEFISDSQIANSIVDDVIEKYESYIGSSNYNEAGTKMSTVQSSWIRNCDTIQEPSSPEDSALIARHTSCTPLQTLGGKEFQEAYRDTLAFWKNADDQMNTDNYGHSGMTVHATQESDYSQIKPYGDYVINYGGTALALWFGAAALGAGATAVRRRADQDRAKARKSSRSRHAQS
jgi:hypothetical protein